MIAVKFPLHKTDGVDSAHLCYFGEHTEAVYNIISYTMATWDLPDTFSHALGPVAFGLRHMYIKQIPHSHSITIKYTTMTPQIKGNPRVIYHI